MSDAQILMSIVSVFFHGEMSSVLPPFLTSVAHGQRVQSVQNPVSAPLC